MSDINTDLASFGNLSSTFASFSSFSYTVGENLVLNEKPIFAQWD